MLLFTVLLLNQAAAGPINGVSCDDKWVHLLPIAPSVGCKEVGQLETDRAKIIQGMIDGARQVVSIFGESLGLSDEDQRNVIDSIFPEIMLKGDSLPDKKNLLDSDTIMKMAGEFLPQNKI